MAETAYFPYLVIFHYICAFILSLPLIFYSTKTLYHNKVFSKNNIFSPVITIYFINTFLGGICLFLFSGYTVAFWRHSSIYDARILYFGGLIWNQLMTTNGIIEILLCVDRIFTILSPMKYSGRLKHIFAGITVATLITFLILWAWINDFVGIIPSNPSTTCLFFACIVPRDPGLMIGYSKLFVCSTNLFGTLVLVFILNFYASNSINKTNRRVTKTLIIIGFVSTVIDFIPYSVSVLIQTFFHISVMEYIGPFSTTFSSFSITVCVMIYSRAVLKISKHNSAISPVMKYTA